MTTRLNRPKADAQWTLLAQNDWGNILELAQKKSFQRKFEIVECFMREVAAHGIQKVDFAQLSRSSKTSRQLIKHHFPTDQALLLLSFRYMYARFQKYCSDALISRSGAVNQFRAYITAIPSWVSQYPSDSRFLVQYFVLSPTDPAMLSLFERNIEMGRRRIQMLLSGFPEEAQIKQKSDERLYETAYSIQKQIAGYVMLASAREKHEPTQVKRDQQELLQACLAVAER